MQWLFSLPIHELPKRHENDLAENLCVVKYCVFLSSVCNMNLRLCSLLCDIWV